MQSGIKLVHERPQCESPPDSQESERAHLTSAIVFVGIGLAFGNVQAATSSRRAAEDSMVRKLHMVGEAGPQLLSEAAQHRFLVVRQRHHSNYKSSSG